MEWGEQKLSSLCDMFTDGDWVESKDQSAEGVRLIQTGNVGEGVFKDRRDKSRFISEETFSRLKCTEILEGDCLVSRLPDPVGRSCLIPFTGEKMITAVDCTIIRLNRSHLLPEFFNYFTQSYAYLNVVESLTSGATRKRISRKNLGEVPIPLPPIPEQQRIVAILDQAFADIEKARANAEKNLKNAHELFDSYLDSVCEKASPLPARLIGDVCNLYQGIAINKKTKHLLVEKSSLPLLRIKDLKHNSEEQYVAEEGYPVNARVYENDILYTRTGSLGLVFKGRSGVLHNNSFKVEPNELIDRDYFFWWLQHATFKKSIMKLALKAAQPDITHAIFKQQIIKIPPLSYQKEAVKNIEIHKIKTDELILKYQAKLLGLEELKKSLLQKAFSGELTKAEGHAA